VVVRGESGLFQPPGLIVGEHAERDACLHVEFAHDLDHFENALELRAILHLAPGRSHAETRRSEFLRPLRLFSDLSKRQERRRFDRSLEMGALGTIAAVFRTASRLDAQENAPLDVGRIVVFTMHLGGTKKQVREGQTIDGLEFGEGLHPPVL